MIKLTDTRGKSCLLQLDMAIVSVTSENETLISFGPEFGITVRESVDEVLALWEAYQQTVSYEVEYEEEEDDGPPDYIDAPEEGGAMTVVGEFHDHDRDTGGSSPAGADRPGMVRVSGVPYAVPARAVRGCPSSRGDNDD